jgi:Lysyl oxidase
LRFRRAAQSSALVIAAIVIATVVAPATFGGKPAGPAAVYPDIIEAIPDHLGIQNDHQHEWLRFSTTHINIGEGNLQIRGGTIVDCSIDDGTGTIIQTQCTQATQEVLDASGNVVLTNDAGLAFFHPEHNHWHQSGVAAFEIRQTLGGQSLTSGIKITFCFVDVETFSLTGTQKKTYPRTYFECNGDFQGLAAHWADEYHQSTPLQELEVTGLPAGDYYLTHEADPFNHWLEGTTGGEANNFAWVQFHLGRTGSNPEITILGHSPCVVPAQCSMGGNP